MLAALRLGDNAYIALSLDTECIPAIPDENVREAVRPKGLVFGHEFIVLCAPLGGVIIFDRHASRHAIVEVEDSALDWAL